MRPKEDLPQLIIPLEGLPENANNCQMQLRERQGISLGLLS